MYVREAVMAVGRGRAGECACCARPYVLPPMFTIHVQLATYAHYYVQLPPMRAHITLSKPNRCDERSPEDMRKKKPWLRRPRTHYRKDDPN